MLDVHVLVMEYTPAAVVAQCRASIAEAVVQARFPVAVHYLPGILGHLGQARVAGYGLGDYPYVTHVDDDDWVEPNAFAVLGEHLAAGVEAITTGENIIANGVATPAPRSQHHLAVFRREALNDISIGSFRFYPDQYALSMVSPIHLPLCVYNHRINQDSGSRKQRRANKAEADRELSVIRRPDLAVLEGATAAEIAALADRALRGA